MQLSIPLAFLGLIETALLLAAWLAAAHLVAGEDPWSRAVYFTAVMLLSLFALGMFIARQRARFGGILVRIVTAVGLGTFAVSGLFWLMPHQELDFMELAASALFSFAGLGISRTVYRRVAESALFKRRVLVYGAGIMAESLSHLRRRTDRAGFEIVGFVRPEDQLCVVDNSRIIAPHARLAQTCRQLKIDEIVIAMDDRRRAFPLDEMLECRLDGREVTELVTFLERETGRVRVDVLNPSWMIFANGFRRNRFRLAVTRLFDICASLVILVCALPVMLLTAIAIKLEDGPRAPVFYLSTRVGKRGKPFKLIKFRSMRVDACEERRPRWAQPGDPRITRVGALIRKLRIDELPQVVNVLRGQMSCVGPRPEQPEFVVSLEESIPYYAQRHCVKPGITGWAQICYGYGATDEDAQEKLQYDLYYIKNNSFMFDVSILLQTVEVVLFGKGAR